MSYKKRNQNITLNYSSEAGRQPFSREQFNGPLRLSGSVYVESNLGIGISSPLRKLDLKANPGSTQPFQITTNDFVSLAAGSIFVIEFGAASGDTWTQIAALKTGGSAWGDLILQPGSGTGQVGIGTQTPSHKLDIVDSVRISGDSGDGAASSRPTQFNICGATNPDLKFEFGMDTSSKTGIIGCLEELVAWRNIVVCNNGGFFGVGRIPAVNDLEVEGNASKTAATTWLANSDRKIKTDIRTISNGLDVIKQLNPVVFKYTKEYRKKHPTLKVHDYYNFIAQEYQEVFPNSVQNSKEDDILQIETGAIVPYLVAAIKQQQVIIENLRSRLDTIEAS